MDITVYHLRKAVESAAVRMRAVEQELNAADAKLGDGDTGVTLRRVFDKLATTAPHAPADIGGFFRALGMAGASASGSSLGTLLAIALLDLGKATAGRDSLSSRDLGVLLSRANGAMMQRGQASLGDKTVLDAVNAVAEAVLNAGDAETVSEKAVAAVHAVLTDFRSRPCRTGRARMFGERSIGMDDPGMLAFAHLVDAVAGYANAPDNINQ